MKVGLFVVVAVVVLDLMAMHCTNVKLKKNKYISFFILKYILKE
jgi:hypothetical protein